MTGGKLYASLLHVLFTANPSLCYRGKMELAIGVSVGSSIQIAVGVIPALVVVGWIIGQPLTVGYALRFTGPLQGLS